MEPLAFYPLCGIGEITPKSSLADELTGALGRGGLSLAPGDILVVAHKIVSKAEGRQVALSSVEVSRRAQELSAKTGKSPQLVQLILDESQEVVAAQRGVLMCRHRLGWVCANAGVDQSNTAGSGYAVLLPLDPDASAKRISEQIEAKTGVKVAVIIADTHGRPLREGIVGVAIGSYGISPMRSYIGEHDRAGRPMTSSVEAVADEIAGAASLLIGQGKESIPAVLMRGYAYQFADCGISALKRDKNREIFAPREEA